MAALLWEEYWGELHQLEEDGSYRIFGLENISQNNLKKRDFSFAKSGTTWGFVESGEARINSPTISWTVQAGQWFCEASGQIDISLSENSRCFMIHKEKYTGLFAMGGPIEQQGRLKYIDGCTDTLLYSPPLLGEPCLNLLHFPEKIDQTPHTHPSFRSGIVSSGKGFCSQNGEDKELKSGMIFYIPKNSEHRFKTPDTNVLNVIAFHPDSDWGPTHEVHPMINRTWVDGKKITNND